MHGRTYSRLVTFFATVLLAACGDVTTPALTHSADPGRVATVRAHESAVEMPCTISLQPTPGARRWTARHTNITFPVPTLSPENRTTIFFVRGYNDRNEITAVAACVIPATPEAIEWVSRAFKVTHVKHGFDSAADGVTVMDGEPAFALEPLVATACAPGYVGDYPDCEPIGDGDTTPDGGGSTSGSWGTGDGGGGSGTSTGGTGSSGTGSEAAPPDGYDTDPPPADEEEDARN